MDKVAIFKKEYSYIKDINIKKPYTKDTKKEKSCNLISII